MDASFWNTLSVYGSGMIIISNLRHCISLFYDVNPAAAM